MEGMKKENQSFREIPLLHLFLRYCRIASSSP
jgi:hypothetical protein